MFYIPRPLKNRERTLSISKFLSSPQWEKRHMNSTPHELLNTSSRDAPDGDHLPIGVSDWKKTKTFYPFAFFWKKKKPRKFPLSAASAFFFIPCPFGIWLSTSSYTMHLWVMFALSLSFPFPVLTSICISSSGSIIVVSRCPCEF